MAAFYANENLARQVVEALREFGHDVLTTFEAGKANSAVADSDVLAFAAASRRILLTYNRLHFLRLHEQRNTDPSGIVLSTFDPDFERQARNIDSAVRAEVEMRNKILRVNRPS